MSKKIPTKLIVGIVGIIVLLGGLYFFVFSGDSSVTSSSLQVASTTATADGSTAETAVNTDEILRQLNELRRITINTDFFTSPAFLSLKDFGIIINPQEIGRDNPFAPSTYVPAGDSIVPRSNSAVSEPVNSEDSATETTDSSSASATTSTSTESAGN